MARLGALLVLTGLCSSIALKADHKPKQATEPPKIPKRAKFVAGSTLLSAVAGSLAGYYLPGGAQANNPLTHGAINGGLIGSSAGAIAGAGDGKPGTTLAGMIAGGSVGAGTGAGFAGLKQAQLADAAKNCTQIQVPSSFDVRMFVMGSPWYPQWQNEQTHQKADEMNCSMVAYVPRTSGWNFPMHQVVMRHYSLKSNGDPHDSHGTLCGDADHGAKLLMTSCWQPKFGGSPYWVAAFDPANGAAIVVGGQPNKFDSVTGKCGYQDAMQNGMWILTRQRIPDETVVSNLKAYMSNTLNMDTSAMIRVPQTACAGVFPPPLFKNKGSENE